MSVRFMRRTKPRRKDMVKILNGVTQKVMLIFFQALNAHNPKGRDEIYHSSEWIRHMDPYCSQQPGKEPGTVNFVVQMKEESGVSLRVEGGSLDYLDRCFKDAMNNGVFGFMAGKNVLEAEDVLKKAVPEI